MAITAGLSSAASTTDLRSTGVMGERHPLRGADVVSARLALESGTQLFLFILDEPADHLPPERLDEIGRNAGLGRASAYLVDHLLIAPGHVGLLARLELQLPGSFHVAETLGDAIDKCPVDAIDLGANLRHVATLGRLAGRRGMGGHGLDVLLKREPVAEAGLQTADRNGNSAQRAARRFAGPGCF